MKACLSWPAIKRRFVSDKKGEIPKDCEAKPFIIEYQQGSQSQKWKAPISQTMDGTIEIIYKPESKFQFQNT